MDVIVYLFFQFLFLQYFTIFLLQIAVSGCKFSEYFVASTRQSTEKSYHQNSA